jgi:UDP-4-amino-4,6-dideoxy-N-acetyl-beta-L-altrosamine transaminase
MKTINYGRQEITQEDIDAVVSALKGDFLTQGPLVTQFENEFAKFVGVKHAVAVNNATSGLHIAYLALGFGPGKTVITTPNTFVATGNGALYCGADVAFADIDPKTLCLDPNRVEDLLKNSKSKKYTTIAPVSFAGHPVNMQDFKDLADKYELTLIEDACHAPGAKFKTKEGSWSKSGSCDFADITVFSFHPVKHIATGEGGMLTTNDDTLATKLRELRSHGIVRDHSRLLKQNDGPWYHEMQSLGYNYRLPDLNCALGISQLKRIESNLKRRTEIAARYVKELKDEPITLPQTSDDKIFHAHHLFVIQTDSRAQLFEFLKSKNVNAQVHYIPVHQQPYYKKLYGEQSFPNSEAYYDRALSIPMYHGMTDSEQSHVIETIREFFKNQ